MIGCTRSSIWTLRLVERMVQMNPASSGVVDDLRNCRYIAFVGELRNIWLFWMTLVLGLFPRAL